MYLLSAAPKMVRSAGTAFAGRTALVVQIVETLSAPPQILFIPEAIESIIVG
jgi:hypothetical protein